MKFSEYRKEQMKDPKYRKAVEEVKYDLSFQCSILLDEVRLKYGLTQKELAAKMGVKQSTIARAEGGQHLSVKLLEKAVKAVDGKGLKITSVFNKIKSTNNK